MHAARVIGFVLLGMLIIGTGLAAPSKGGSWLATGTVIKLDGNTVFFLGRDNAVYRIDTSGAVMLSDSSSTDVMPRPGDLVRVFGRITGAGEVRAARVRVLKSAGAKSAAGGSGPGKEIRIIVENNSEEAGGQVVEEGKYTPGGPGPPLEQVPSTTWQGKGLISDIDYVGRQIKIQTSDGPFTINVDNAIMVRGTVRVRFSGLNQGDAIWVSGNEVAPYVVDGRMIRVLRSATEVQNAIPMMPTSVVGVIQQIDYPSRTFKMTSQSTIKVVSCDDNTVIQFQQIKKCFVDLKPGTRINMSGYGNSASGWAAQHIQIIAVSP